MKISILSLNSRLYSTRRLREAATERGHCVHVLNYLRCSMNLHSGVYLAGKPWDCDAIIPRIGSSYTFYGSAVIKQFEMQGVFSTLGAQALSLARDKLRSMQVLSQGGLALPITGFAHHPKDIEGLIQSVGGPPIVIKLREGTQGIGVVLAETQQAAVSVISALRRLDANILLQEYISEAKGSDIRVVIVGGRMVAAMRRQAPRGEFRANIHRGGNGEKIELSPEETDLAERAAAALGLEVAGVDLIRSRRGTLVLEVNASPGFEGIEAVSGVDVATAIVRYVEANVESRLRLVSQGAGT